MSRIVAIIGSYRRGGTTDLAVDAVLDGARREGAEICKIYLIDQYVEFCDNCRGCTQQDGLQRGRCPREDDLDWILRQVEGADGVVLAAPVNFFNTTAIFRQFLERLVGYVYWPWGSRLGPVLRDKRRTKRAVLVSSAAMPSFLIPLTTGAPRALRMAARMLGARPAGTLWIGQAAVEEHQPLTAHARECAVRLGRKLVRI